MKITQLYIYPIKSLGAISLAGSDLTTRGFTYDRRWLLTDENYRFITQRETRELSRFMPDILGETLSVTDHRTGSRISFGMNEVSSNTRQVTVWNDVFPATEVSGAVSRWFSEQLQREVRLMYQPDDSHRKIDARYAVTGEEIVSAADGYPILLISEGSLSELNSRLANDVSALRFRPNIVVDGMAPHEEDELGRIELGEAVLQGVKPSSRCVMVDRDPLTGETSGDVLKTLSGYRREGNKIKFGQNCVVLKTGHVRVGDSLKRDVEKQFSLFE